MVHAVPHVCSRYILFSLRVIDSEPEREAEERRGGVEAGDAVATPLFCCSLPATCDCVPACDRPRLHLRSPVSPVSLFVNPAKPGGDHVLAPLVQDAASVPLRRKVPPGRVGVPLGVGGEMRMVGKKGKGWKKGIVQLWQREVGDLTPRTFEHRLGASEVVV
ncbi:hypothetical protein Taro_048813 [Colocasia esculenta]|uniref:Uncharacterized protein n=1 Tax=Colocasia esculenta TaxID=4460 RepID=A0A843X973_COLES|nr:hypothetical protein [Colocasia esculenta]